MDCLCQDHDPMYCEDSRRCPICHDRRLDALCEEYDAARKGE